MTINDLKKKLYERVNAYWGGATVAWGGDEQSQTKRAAGNAAARVCGQGGASDNADG
jgi:hypothetical protein